MIFGFIGFIFVAVGTVLTIIFSSVGIGFFSLIPILFIVLGLGFIGAICVMKYKQKEIIKKGKRYVAKIFGYQENTSYTVNGSYPINTVVHYFDEHSTLKEAIIPTQFPKGSNQFPIGMTIDIFEYNGKFGYDPASIRQETLYREEELMDNKPVDPSLLTMVGIPCPNCGASFKAAKGYSAKCPYCGSQLNV